MDRLPIDGDGRALLALVHVVATYLDGFRPGGAVVGGVVDIAVAIAPVLPCHVDDAVSSCYYRVILVATKEVDLVAWGPPFPVVPFDGHKVVAPGSVCVHDIEVVPVRRDPPAQVVRTLEDPLVWLPIDGARNLGSTSDGKEGKACQSNNQPGPSIQSVSDHPRCHYHLQSPKGPDDIGTSYNHWTRC